MNTTHLSYYTQHGRRVHVPILKFEQAAALLGHKRKQPEPQTFKLTRCHDGVWRVLAEAPKFRSGGVTGTWTDQGEYIINPKSYGFPG